MFKMTANFYPADEVKNGYIGKANLSIAEAIKINGISVFDHDGNFSIRFPDYERRDNGERDSYVVPKNAEAYAAMRDVIKMAVNDEKYHFGHVNGNYNPYLTVAGRDVEEPYADGRFSVEVGNLCTLYGITTRIRNKDKDPFVAVDMPTIGKYTNRDNEIVYNKAFEGLVYRFKKDGKEEAKDFGLLINNLVRSEREKIYYQDKPSFDNKLKDASMEAEKRNAERTNDTRKPREKEYAY